MNVTATSPAPALQRSGLTLALCFAAAIIEGIDLQSMGIAASGIAAEFHLTAAATIAALLLMFLPRSGDLADTDN